MRKQVGISSLLLGLLLVSLFSYAIYSNLNPQHDMPIVFLSTTTSVENTGLLDYLIEQYHERSNFRIKYTAVGSGSAIQLARDGEVDAILTHAPKLEESLIADGFSDKRFELWYNYFTIVGPSSDPAGLSSSNSTIRRFQEIFNSGVDGISNFYSRGDNSGTHIRELEIWHQSNLTVSATKTWYFETGTGMASTLITTNNDPVGYTLTDIGTYATIKSSPTELDIIIFYQEDPIMYNPYSYLVINSSETGTDLNTDGAYDFLNFLQQPSTADLVRSYTRGGINLFHPFN